MKRKKKRICFLTKQKKRNQKSKHTKENHQKMVVKSRNKEIDFLKNNDLPIKFLSLIFRLFEQKKTNFVVSLTMLQPKEDLNDSWLIMYIIILLI